MQSSSPPPPKPETSAPEPPEPGWKRLLKRAMAMLETQARPGSRRAGAASTAVRYASFNERVFASVIDIGVSLILLGPLFFLLSEALHGGGAPTTMPAIHSMEDAARLWRQWQASGRLEQLLIDYAVHYAVFAAIVIWFWNKSAATPGKWLLKMRIVDQNSFCKPSRRQLIVRYLGYIPIFLTLTLGFIWVMFERKRRGWHDLMAGTVVVKVDHWRFHDDGTTPHVTPPDAPASDNA